MSVSVFVMLCIAELSQDGELHITVEQVKDLGSLTDINNYLKFVSFLFNHRRWFRDTVWSVIEERTASDSYWLDKKLERAKGLHPWTEGRSERCPLGVGLICYLQ
jgi:hypothetical protein